MAETLGDRVKSRRKALRWSQTKLAEEVGVAQSTIVDIEKGVTSRPRILVELAQALGMSVNELVHTNTDGLQVLQTQRIINRADPAPEGFRYIRVKGEVSAGTWKEMVEEDSFDAYDIPIVQDPRYPEGSLFGLVVRGSSVNQFARDGEVAICLDVWQAPRPYQHDDLVVVRRTRNTEFETTIKLVRYHEGELRLFTASTDPRFDNDKPISVDPDAESDVQIIGFALHFVRLGTRL